MSVSYREVDICKLPQGAIVSHHFHAHKVSLDSPAVEVMTDLRATKPITVASYLHLNQALEKMIHAGVRLLLVTDVEDRLVGLISAKDIMGEAPVKIAMEEGIDRDALTVEQIMLRPEQIDVMSLRDVHKSRVGDLITTLKHLGRQHALVCDDTVSPPQVCGIISSSQVGRQLGMDIQPSMVAQSFVELEKQLLGE